ncbi:hypothetical protein GCM10008905_13110 [Clostridium malenominatum]|uniref:Peptidase C45 hydrolase domain-containing protein n=1 Tax=Clostridium malenominatum TaxID=1539 RepID=A0ABN1IV85_9CLOT
MKNKIKLIEVKGSPYERGYKSGVELKYAIKSCIKAYVDLKNNKELMDKMLYIKALTKEVFPEYLLEVEGRADGAGVDRDLYFLIMCAELLNEGVGCTTLVFKRKDGTIILGHNEDDNYTPGNSALTKCWNNEDWFVTYDYCNMPFGNAFSFNSHGIVKTINYCYSENVSTKGIPRYFLQRYISEASSLEDFVKRCSIDNRGSGFHAVALDSKTNKALSIEVSANKISVKEIHNHYVHTNHYIHPGIFSVNEEVSAGSTSPFRLKKAGELLEEKINKVGDNISIKDFEEILNYRGKDYKSSILGIKEEPNFTCSRILYDTKVTDKVWMEFFEGEEHYYQDYNKFNI